jgi:hypothetical protein
MDLFKDLGRSLDPSGFIERREIENEISRVNMWLKVDPCTEGIAELRELETKLKKLQEYYGLKHAQKRDAVQVESAIF